MKMPQKKKKITRKNVLAIYSVCISILVIYATNSYAQEDILMELKNPFIAKIPKVIKEEKNILNNVATALPTKDDQQRISPTSRIQAKNITNKIASTITEPIISMPTVSITGVLWNSTKPQAIINGEVLGIGDKVGNANIINIGPSQVVFKILTKTFTINVE